ncbi:MAG TPA: hypothetical protein VGJ86_00105, partial [Acidimicrobiales bacterium]
WVRRDAAADGDGFDEIAFLRPWATEELRYLEKVYRTAPRRQCGDRLEPSGALPEAVDLGESGRSSSPPPRPGFIPAARS